MRSVGQQSLENRVLARSQLALGLDEMPERGGDAADRVPGMGGRERGVELPDAKRRERVAPAQREEVRHARHGVGKRDYTRSAYPEFPR